MERVYSCFCQNLVNSDILSLSFLFDLFEIFPYFHTNIHPSIHPQQRGGQRRLTGVEVFGFGQFDGGSSLLLQLDDGLTSFPDDGTRRIAGNQNLQEVLAFLCSGEQETGSQIEPLQFMLLLFFCFFLNLQKEKNKSNHNMLH